MKDIIGFILFICLLINDFIKPNETEYASKRTKFRTYVWLIWIMKILENNMTQFVISHMRTKHQRREIIRRMRKTKVYRYRKLTSKQPMVADQTLVIQTNMDPHENVTRFDTDSAPVGIGNRCTVCISHMSQDFIGPLREANRSIKGFGGTRTDGVKIGTLS